MHNKGQEEITGFVLVIIVVAVIGLLLLAFVLRNPGNSIRTDSFAVRQFLDSSMKVTTECTLRSAVDYASIDDLVKNCYNSPGQACYNSGKSVCEAMNSSLASLLGSLPVGQDKLYSGYIFNISFERKSANVTQSYEQVYYDFKGNCSTSMRAGEYFTRVGAKQGNLVSTLTLCN